MKNNIIEKYNSIALPAKAAIWFMVCSIIPQVMSVIMTTIFTRILSQDDYGSTSNYMAWYNIISIFITLNLNCGVYNNAMMKYENKRDEYTSSILGMSIVLGGIGLIVAICFLQPIANIMQLSKSLVVCLALQCLLYNSYGCWLSRAKYEYNYKDLVKVTIIVTFVSSTLSIVAVYLLDDKAAAKIWGQNLIYLILGLIFYIKAFRKSSLFFDRDYWNFALRFNLPLIPHYLSLVLLNQADRVMITSMCGKQENGLYSVAYSAASLLLILNSGITQALTPWVYSNMQKNNKDIIKKYTSILCVIYMLVDIVFILLAPEAILILAGNKYKNSVFVIPPVAASMYLIFLYNLYSIVEFYYEKTKPVMICSIISAGLNLLLNYVFIPQYGYIAAGYTTLICYVVNSLMHIIVLRYLYMKKMNGAEAISTLNTMGLGVVLVILSIMISYLYTNPVVRWAIIIAIVLIGLRLYKRIILIIDAIRKK